MNTPQVKDLAAILRTAGFVVGEAGSTVTRQATPNDALRLVEAMERAGLVVMRVAG